MDDVSPASLQAPLSHGNAAHGSHSNVQRMPHPPPFLAPSTLHLGQALSQAMWASQSQHDQLALQTDTTLHNYYKEFVKLDVTASTLIGLGHNELPPHELILLLARIAAMVGGGLDALALHACPWDRVRNHISLRYNAMRYNERVGGHRNERAVIFFLDLFASGRLRAPDQSDPASWGYAHFVLKPIAQAYSTMGLAGALRATEVLGVRGHLQNAAGLERTLSRELAALCTQEGSRHVACIGAQTQAEKGAPMPPTPGMDCWEGMHLNSLNQSGYAALTSPHPYRGRMLVLPSHWGNKTF